MNDVEQTIFEINALEHDLLNLKKSRDTSLAARTNLHRKKFKLEVLKIKLLQKVKDKHPRLQQLETANRSLLVGQGNPIVVTKTTTNFLSLYTNRLQGRMHSNGFFYGNASNANRQGHHFATFLFLLLNQRKFPKSYKGHINIFGGFTLQVDKTQRILEDSYCPHHITADVSEDGNIDAVVEEYHKHVAESVFKVIFDPFNGDTGRSNKFSQHKQEMLEIVQDFIQHA